jgi:hypothetical protein
MTTRAYIMRLLHLAGERGATDHMLAACAGVSIAAARRHRRSLVRCGYAADSRTHLVTKQNTRRTLWVSFERMKVAA